MVNKRGMTVIEVLLVVAMLTVIGLMGSLLIGRALRFFQFQSAKVELQRESRVSMDTIIRFLRQAKASSLLLDKAPGQPPFSRLKCTLSTTVTLQGATTVETTPTLTFYQQGHKLMLDVITAERRTTGGVVTNTQTTNSSVLSQHIQFITFGFPDSRDPNVVSVSLTTQKSTYSSGSQALQVSAETVRIMN